MAICQGGCLGVLPGDVEGLLGPTEVLMHPLGGMAQFQLIQGYLGLFHQEEGDLRIEGKVMGVMRKYR